MKRAAACARGVLLAAGVIWLLSQWRGAESVTSFTETAMVAIIVGASIFSFGVAYTVELMARVIAGLGLVDGSLRLFARYVPAVTEDVTLQFTVTAVVFSAAFEVSRRSRLVESRPKWDTSSFYMVGVLVVVIATRDKYGAEVSPYQYNNVGVLLLFALAICSFALTCARTWPIARCSRP